MKYQIGIPIEWFHNKTFPEHSDLCHPAINPDALDIFGVAPYYASLGVMIMVEDNKVEKRVVGAQIPEIPSRGFLNTQGQIVSPHSPQMRQQGNGEPDPSERQEVVDYRLLLAGSCNDPYVISRESEQSCTITDTVIGRALDFYLHDDRNPILDITEERYNETIEWFQKTVEPLLFQQTGVMATA